MTQYRIGDLPPMQELGRGGALRFGVVAADGRRSRVWNVIGSRNTRDVFAGARETFGDVKLSFHPTWWRPELGQVSLRWIYIHLIHETARHVGHSDILREQTDGVIGS